MDRFPADVTDYSILHKVEPSSAGHPASFPMGSPTVKQSRHVADHSPPPSDEVKNQWSHTSSSPYAFIGCRETTLTPAWFGVKSFELEGTKNLKGQPSIVIERVKQTTKTISWVSGLPAGIRTGSLSAHKSQVLLFKRVSGGEKLNLDALQLNFAAVFVPGTHFSVCRTCQWLPSTVRRSKMAVRDRLTHLTQERLVRSSPNISATSSTIRTPWSQVRTLKHAVRSSAHARSQTVLRSRRNAVSPQFLASA